MVPNIGFKALKKFGAGGNIRRGLGMGIAAVAGGVMGAGIGAGVGFGAGLAPAIGTGMANRQIISESPFYNQSLMTADRLNANGNIVLGMHNSRRG